MRRRTPAQQALITKSQFSACDPTGVDVDVDVVSFKAVETNEEAADPIPGTDVESAAWAVIAKIKLKYGGQEVEDTDTFRAYQVDGDWVWALDQNGLDQTLNGTC